MDDTNIFLSGVIVGFLAALVIQSWILYPRMVSNTVKRIVADQDKKPKQELTNDDEDAADSWKPPGWKLDTYGSD